MRRFSSSFAVGLAFVLSACSGTGGAPIDPSGDDAAAPVAEADAATATTHGEPTGFGDDDDDASTEDAAHADADADAPHDAGHGAVSDAGAGDAHSDAGPTSINGCTAADFAANDESAPAAPRVISFGDPSVGPGYTPPCLRIARGQAVTWRGRFAQLPLAASGGNQPSPIEDTDTGRAVTFIFAQPGTYGFASPAAPKVMLGAIDVKP